MLHPSLPYADLAQPAFEALFIQLPFSESSATLLTSSSRGVIAHLRGLYELSDMTDFEIQLPLLPPLMV